MAERRGFVFVKIVWLRRIWARWRQIRFMYVLKQMSIGCCWHYARINSIKYTHSDSTELQRIYTLHATNNANAHQIHPIHAVFCIKYTSFQWLAQFAFKCCKIEREKTAKAHNLNQFFPSPNRERNENSRN